MKTGQIYNSFDILPVLWEVVPFPVQIRKVEDYCRAFIQKLFVWKFGFSGSSRTCSMSSSQIAFYLLREINQIKSMFNYKQVTKNPLYLLLFDR